MKQLAILLIAIMFAFACKKNTSQSSSAFIKYFGGDGIQVAYDLKQTVDGGFIIVGSTTSFGAGGSDVYVVKTDKFGNPEWTKTFGGVGNDLARSVDLTSDGGYVILGDFAVATDTNKLFLIRIDELGNTLWPEKKLGFPAGSESGYQVKTLANGDFLLVGKTTFTSVSGGGFGGASDMYAVRTDANGNTLDSTRFGISGELGEDNFSSISISETGIPVACGWQSKASVGSLLKFIRFDNFAFPTVLPNIETSVSVKGNSITKIQGDGFLVIGTQENASGSDFYLLKLTENMSKIWSNSFDLGNVDEGLAVAIDKQNNYLLLGTTDDDITLLKVDENGNEVWDTYKKYGGIQSDFGAKIIPTNDGGFAILGTTSFTVNNVNNQMMVLMKTNSEGDIMQ